MIKLKAIKYVIYIWFAISFTYLFITGTILNWEEYIVHISEGLPNFNSVLNDIMEDIRILFNGYSNLSGFQDVLVRIGYFLKGIFDIAFVPIKVLYYLYKVIVAFIPYFNV